MPKEKLKTSEARATEKVASNKSETKIVKDDTSLGSSPDKASMDTGGFNEQSGAGSDKPSTDNGSSNENATTADATKKNYVRGENQKPVTKAYRDNWNKIFKKP